MVIKSQPRAFSGNLTCQMECLRYLLDLNRMSIWGKARRKRVKSEEPFETNVEANGQTFRLSFSKQTKFEISSLPVEPVGNSAMLLVDAWVNT